MAEYKVIDNGMSIIQGLWTRRQEIQAQIAELKEEDDKIIEELNQKLGVNLQSDSAQKFQIGTLELKVTPKINRTVNSEKVAELLASNEEAQKADVFKLKYDLKVKNWKALGAEGQVMFSDCVTEKPGKSKIEEITGENE